MIWLVRNPIAVAESAIKSFAKKSGGRELSLEAALMTWIDEQWRWFELLKIKRRPHLAVRFEDFVSNPPDALRSLELPSLVGQKDVNRAVDFRAQHHVAGNRIIRNGLVEIRGLHSKSLFRKVTLPSSLPASYRLKLFVLAKVFGYPLGLREKSPKSGTLENE